jgi:hypothetical protein
MTEEEVLVSDCEDASWRVELTIPSDHAKFVALFRETHGSRTGVVVLEDGAITAHSIGDRSQQRVALGWSSSTRFVLAEGMSEAWLLSQDEDALCVYPLHQHKPTRVFKNVFQDSRLALSSAVVHGSQITFLILEDRRDESIFSRIAMIDMATGSLLKGEQVDWHIRCIALLPSGVCLVGGEKGLFSCVVGDEGSISHLIPELEWESGHRNGSMVALNVSNERIVALAEVEDGVTQPVLYQRQKRGPWQQSSLDFDDYIYGSLIYNSHLVVFSSVLLKKFPLQS